MERRKAKPVRRDAKSKNVFKVLLSSDDVINLCIEKNFYTRGNITEYSKMLDMCGPDMTPEKVVDIAQDIVDHSDPENEYLAQYEALDEVICYLQDLLKTRVTIEFEH